MIEYHVNSITQFLRNLDECFNKIIFEGKNDEFIIIIDEPQTGIYKPSLYYEPFIKVGCYQKAKRYSNQVVKMDEVMKAMNKSVEMHPVKFNVTTFIDNIESLIMIKEKKILETLIKTDEKPKKKLKI